MLNPSFTWAAISSLELFSLIWAFICFADFNFENSDFMLTNHGISFVSRSWPKNILRVPWSLLKIARLLHTQRNIFQDLERRFWREQQSISNAGSNCGWNLLWAFCSRVQRAKDKKVHGTMDSNRSFVRSNTHPKQRVWAEKQARGGRFSHGLQSTQRNNFTIFFLNFWKFPLSADSWCSAKPYFCSELMRN